MNPKISVVMTVFNDERFIEYSIKSMLNQTFTDFEFIIINDGSTDNTTTILNKFVAYDNRIRIVNQENSGTTMAANRGVRLANGEYIARIDSDDYSYPFRLKYEADYLDKNPNCGLIGGGAEIIDNYNRIIGIRNIASKYPRKTLQHRCIFQQSDVMFRKRIFEKVGGYREKFRNAQDYDLWLRISEGCDIYKTQKILGQWRLNAGGYTLSRSKEQKKEVGLVKDFSRQRQRNGVDCYDSYTPSLHPIHRNQISTYKYSLIVGLVQIQALKRKEGRNNILFSLKGEKTIIAFIFLLISYLPTIIIRPIFRLRDYFLNNF